MNLPNAVQCSVCGQPVPKGSGGHASQEGCIHALGTALAAIQFALTRR